MSNVKISELPVASGVDVNDYLLGNVDGVTSRIVVDSANGVAILDAGGKIPSGRLPAIAISEIFVVSDNAERDGLTVQEGDVAKVITDNLTYIFDGSSWVELVASYAVDSVNGETGAVVLDTDDIGEGTNQYFTEERASSTAIPFSIALG